MFIKVLGALAVEIDRTPVEISAVTQRRAILFLTIHANEVVTVDRLADAVWCDQVPAQLEHAVQSLVYRLRRRLGDCPPGSGSGTQYIQRIDPGYRLTIDPLQIDSNQFTATTRRARQVLATDPAAARILLWEALGLWRGDALLDVADDVWAAADIRRLTELRLCACEALAEANIVLGEPELAIAELESLTERFPLRESLWALLWRAFAESGRHLDIAASHRRPDELLVEQFDMLPSAHLAQLAHSYTAQD